MRWNTTQLMKGGGRGELQQQVRHSHLRQRVKANSGKLQREAAFQEGFLRPKNQADCSDGCSETQGNHQHGTQGATSVSGVRVCLRDHAEFGRHACWRPSSCPSDGAASIPPRLSWSEPLSDNTTHRPSCEGQSPNHGRLYTAQGPLNGA